VKSLSVALRLLCVVSIGLYACAEESSTPGGPLDGESPVGSAQQATTCTTSWTRSDLWYTTDCSNITTSGACNNHYVSAPGAFPPRPSFDGDVNGDWWLCQWNTTDNPNHCEDGSLLEYTQGCTPTCEGASLTATECIFITTQGACNGHYWNDGSNNWLCAWNPTNNPASCQEAGFCNP
jgi:hypothetical protein